MAFANGAIPFELVKPISAGVQGLVYLAMADVGAGMTQVAVKKITLKMEENEQAEQVRNLDNQLSGILALRHPNVVHHYSTHVGKVNQPEPTSYWIVMEHCSGPTLHTASKSRIAPRTLQKWTNDMLLGLEYLYNNKIVHRDIKPENVFLSTSDRNSCSLKIGDLGNIKTLLADATNRREVSHTRGTCAFMSPEMIQAFTRDVNIGRRTDIWSLGCVIIQMITGQAPTFCKIDAEGNRIAVEGDAPIMWFVANGGSPEYPTNIPPVLRNFIDACLRQDPKTRPTAADLLRHDFVTADPDWITGLDPDWITWIIDQSEALIKKLKKSTLS